MTKYLKKFSTGEVTVPLMVAFTIGVAVVTWISSYYVQANAQDSKVSEVRQDVAVHEKQIDTLEKSYAKIEDKLDKLLWANGINPNTTNTK